MQVHESCSGDDEITLCNTLYRRTRDKECVLFKPAFSIVWSLIRGQDWEKKHTAHHYGNSFQLPPSINALMFQCKFPRNESTPWPKEAVSPQSKVRHSYCVPYIHAILNQSCALQNRLHIYWRSITRIIIELVEACQQIHTHKCSAFVSKIQFHGSINSAIVP